jgi:hypothetical protein
MRMAAGKHKKIEKVSGKIEEIEETLDRDNLKRRTPGGRRPTDSLSPVQADRPRSTSVRCRSRLRLAAWS